MELEKFTPSLDWGTELVKSLFWVSWVWAVTAACTMVILVLVGRYTVWGRQFWQITGDYFKGPESVRVWLWVALLLLMVILGVRLDVLLSYWSNDMYSSAQVAVQAIGGDEEIRQSGVHGFWTSWIVFAVIATLHVIRIMTDLWLMQRFMLRWRTWLTHRLSRDWLEGHSYYRNRFIADGIDNPDQRIQMDVDVFTAGVGPLPNTPNNTTTATLLFGAVNAIVSVASFAAILWNLSHDMDMFGVRIPKAMFWGGMLVIVFATVIAFWIGRPIIRLQFDNEKFNAAFRYALVRLRDAAEAVAFYRGEAAEWLQLRTRFIPVVRNYQRYINRMTKFYGWNLTVSQAMVPVPWLFMAGRLFEGSIKLGDVTQANSAFSNITDGLSFFRNSYDDFAGWRASIMRLHGLAVANQEGRELPKLEVTDSRDCMVELSAVEVRTPAGELLISPLDLRLDEGDTLIVTGRSGSGKSTLLRSLAQLWPYTSGTFRCPGGADETMFLSQMPYVPLGDLRAVVSYPRKPGEIPDDVLIAMLTKVALPACAKRLDEVADWAKVLSPGEQQRIAFARILLTKPKVVFMDEATSALDESLEYMLYDMVRTELPDTIVVSVTHRSSVDQHHEQELELLGGGEWRLGPCENGRPSPAPVG